MLAGNRADRPEIPNTGGAEEVRAVRPCQGNGTGTVAGPRPGTAAVGGARTRRKVHDMPEFLEPHRRGELVVAAMMNAFIDIWVSRLARIGFLQRGKKDRESGRRGRGARGHHLLTMSIRALDYCPTTDIDFSRLSLGPADDRP